jgi:hypothetical protein
MVINSLTYIDVLYICRGRSDWMSCVRLSVDVYGLN